MPPTSQPSILRQNPDAETDVCLHVAYCHGAHALYLAYVAALQAHRPEDIVVVSPMRHSVDRAVAAMLTPASRQVLAELGVGSIEVIGNEAEGTKLGGVARTIVRLATGDRDAKRMTVVTRHPIPFHAYNQLQRLAHPATIVTGDQSFSDAIAMGKAIIAVEPMYCQTWVLDAQIASAEAVSADLARVLRFATAGRWDAGFWPEVSALLQDGAVVEDARKWAQSLAQNHALEPSLPALVSRAVAMGRDPALRLAQGRAWRTAWGAFSVSEGLSIPTTM